jgi:hypothetical protein
MPIIQVDRLQSHTHAEIFFSQLVQTPIVTEPLELNCNELSFLGAHCTLSLLTASRLWFRWTGEITKVYGLTDQIHEHLVRLRIFDLPGETLIDADPLSYQVPNHYGPINRRRIAPLFIPGHQESNRTVINEVLDAVEETINYWFEESRLVRDVNLILSELGENIMHSNDYGYLFLQRYGRQNGNQIVIAISDLGIGIRTSLERRQHVHSGMVDSECIHKALQHRVSGAGNNRGIGLYEVWTRAQRSARSAELRIRSGGGALTIRNHDPVFEDDLAYIPGVQITLTLEGAYGQNFSVWA